MIEVFRTSQVVDEVNTCVEKGKLNELAVTGTTSPVAVASGVAWVYGCWYQNDSSLNVTVPTPATNPRIDRIVLRYGSAAQTVRITRLAGTEAASPTAPTLTQNSTTYEISLAQVRITTGGVITVTDERGFITDPGAAGAVDNSTLNYDTSAKKIRIAPTGSPTVAGLSVSASSSGSTVLATTSNTSNTANSAAKNYIVVAGASAADPTTQFTVSGVTDWAIGIDNSDSDKFKIAAAGALGSSDVLTLDTSGNATVSGPSLVVTQSNSGGTVVNLTNNTSNTANSAAKNYIVVAGTSAGDPFTQYTVTGATDWSVGIDNSDSDKFKISASGALGSSDEMVLDTSGNVTFTGGITGASLTTAGALTAASATVSGAVSAGSVTSGATTTAASSSGAVVIDTVSNTSNTANSHAKSYVAVAGASGGNPTTHYIVTGATDWSVGIDNVDSDKFKISQSSAIGTNVRFSMDTTGNATIAGSATIGTGLTVSAGSVSLPSGSIATAAIADNAIDDTKVGDRVPQFYRRQGGSATDWTTQGTSTQTPTAVRMQSGTIRVNFSASVTASTTVTFPTAFSNPPIVLVGNLSGNYYTNASGITASQASINAGSPTSITTATDLFWLAIGSE